MTIQVKPWFFICYIVLNVIFSKQSLSQTIDINIGQQYQLVSTASAQSYEINVYLPPSYQQTQKPYPVLYLLDGGVNQDFVHIAGIASLAADYRHIAEFIVVGVKSNDRYHELTSPSQDPLDNKELPTNGGAKVFRQFLLEQVKPWVAQQYRVTQQAALMGESLAGLFVAETFALMPQSFTDYIAISPSLWWNKQALVKQLPALSKSWSTKNSARLFVSIADEGGAMRQGVEQLVLLTQQANIHVKFEPMPEETHATIYHPSALTAVRWVFASAEAKASE